MKTKSKVARLLTNFDVGQLPAYREAIRRFGGRVRRTRLTIGKPPNCDSVRSLYLSGPDEDLSRFWSILDTVRAEQSTVAGE